MKHELFTSPTFLGIKLYPSSLEMRRGGSSILDGGLHDETNGFPVGDLIDRGKWSCVGLLLQKQFLKLCRKLDLLEEAQ